MKNTLIPAAAVAIMAVAIYATVAPITNHHRHVTCFESYSKERLAEWHDVSIRHAGANATSFTVYTDDFKSIYQIPQGVTCAIIPEDNYHDESQP